MVGRLLDELQQKRPFQRREEEAYLNLIRTADLLRRSVAELLKGHDLTPAQYNVLRILRGAGDTLLSCSEVGSRLVTFEPDVTRLVDRLVTHGLADRLRARQDRRVVRLRITAKGLALLRRLDAAIVDVQTERLGRLSDDRLVQLIELLEELRAEPDAASSSAP